MLENAFYLSEKSIGNYYREIFNADDGKWQIFVLINRKGYWDYKITALDAKLKKSQIVYSDRMLEKLPNQELNRLLKDSRVVVYDDSLTNGSNLFFYFLLCKAAGAREVLPVVYALNTSFPSERSRDLMRREAQRFQRGIPPFSQTVEELIDEFVGKIRWRVLLNTHDIDRMSIWQTVLFQRRLSPLVMDLPIFNRESSSPVQGKITISKDEFTKLCSCADKRWKFVENEMKGLDETIRACYFHFESKLLNDHFKSLFHDFVVKCKYNFVNDMVEVVFTPFAIVKSISFEDVIQCFLIFFKGTSYGENILHNFPDIVEGDLSDLQADALKKDHNLCRALFRAVIFQLSDYIGRQFQQYVANSIGVQIEYDWDIMKDNFSYDFIETEKKLYEAFNDEEFRNKVYKYNGHSKIFPLEAMTQFPQYKVKATCEKINCYVRSRIIDKKKSVDISLSERIYTFETMEYEVDNTFYFSNDLERQEYLTRTCLLFLETNSFSNFIYVDDADRTIYRGFRYGENSEILLHDSLWLFYAYLWGLYDTFGIRDLKKHYDTLMGKVKNFLSKQGYINLWISEDGFAFLKNYFGNLNERELGSEIRRRSYWLNCTNITNRKEKLIKSRLIDEAINTIREWEEV